MGVTEKKAEFGRTRSCLKKKMVMKQGTKKVEVGTLLLGNDKNSVIVNKVLSYFECLSFKFEVHVACLGTTVNNNY